ncbi:uncharacterized protein LOC144705248 [Wolffia australiana]
MGCNSSKVEDRALVTLCRERKDLMKSAVDLRFVLTSSHSSYFQALNSAGDALSRFLVEELAIASSSSSSATSSPLLTIPSSDGKRRKSKSDLANNSPSPSSPASLARSFSVEEEEKIYPSFYYSAWQTSANPTTVYEDPYPGYGYWEGYGMQDPSSSFYAKPSPEPPASPPQPPPPTPPPPASSSWSFLDPFDLSQQDLSAVGYGSLASSPNSTDIREREGIPDLEEETESEAARELEREKKSSSASSRKKVVRRRRPRSEGEGSNGSSVLTDSIVESVDESASSKRKGRGSAGRNEKKKEVSFGDENSEPRNHGSELSVHGGRTVVEVAEEVREQFKLAASSGNEVSAVLDVGLPSYRRKRVISSRIGDVFSMLMYSCSSYKHLENSTVNSLRVAKASSEESADRQSVDGGNLSRTLDRLSIWEMKLYEEVKNEENLQMLYEKQRKQLKNLDERGAESKKIESVQAYMRRLLNKIDISIKSIETISREIHRLRDEELQPQITELVERSITMWKRLQDCHQKQFIAMNQCRRPLGGGSSAPKLTKDFEQELLRWLGCFVDWVNDQKHCYFTLNQWLQRCIATDPEDVTDGAPPHSPGRRGAPPAFITVNDLAELMRDVSEHQVVAALDSCAAKVRSLWMTQDTVQRRRQQADFLSKDLARNLRNGNTKLISKMIEERDMQREAVKEANGVVQSSLRDGLVPVFRELGSFAGEVLRAYEEVRLPPHPSLSST